MQEKESAAKRWRPLCLDFYGATAIGALVSKKGTGLATMGSSNKGLVL